MALMSPCQLTRLWTRLPLSGSTIAQDIADAARAADDASKTLLDCPWNYSPDRYFKARRVAWRLAFRTQREQGEVPFIAITERRAA
jgi:hypothetical protein